MAHSTEWHKHSHSRSELNCDLLILGYAGLCIICYTIRTTTFLKMAQEVFLRQCSVGCLVTRSKSNQPAIRKRDNWIDSFADFYNSQRYVLGVMSQQQRRKVVCRQDKKILITDPFQTVATIDLTIKFWIFHTKRNMEMLFSQLIIIFILYQNFASEFLIHAARPDFQTQ